MVGKIRDFASGFWRFVQNLEKGEFHYFAQAQQSVSRVVIVNRFAGYASELVIEWLLTTALCHSYRELL